MALALVQELDLVVESEVLSEKLLRVLVASLPFLAREGTALAARAT
jgi:hypothetical protein